MAWTGKSSAKTGCPRNSSSRPATPWPCKSWRLRVGGKSKKVTVGYKYYSGQHHVCCHGPIDYFSRILVDDRRSEEHTSELQSLMRISYAVFCLKKKKITILLICKT